MYGSAVFIALKGRATQIEQKTWQESSARCLIPIGIKAGLVAWGVIIAAGSEHARLRISEIETPSIWSAAQALKEQTVECSMLTGFVGWLARGLNAIRNKRTGHELKRRFRRLPGLFANAPNAGQPSAIDKELSDSARGLNAIRNKRTGHELKRRFRRLPGLFANAPNAGQPSAIDKELSELSEWLLQNFLVNEISAKDFHAAEARLAHVGMLIQKRRRSAALHQLESFFGQWQSSA